MWPFCIAKALLRGVNRPSPAGAIAAEWHIFPRTQQYCAGVAHDCLSRFCTASNVACSLSGGDGNTLKMTVMAALVLCHRWSIEVGWSPKMQFLTYTSTIFDRMSDSS
eukprot:4216831-Ditylum_brightwellii.AAC.1